VFIIQPLGCVYYPVAALPGWLQPICWSLPPTYVFEGLRGVLIDHVLRADLMLPGLAIDSLLFAGAAVAFARLLAGARRAGTLLQKGEQESYVLNPRRCRAHGAGPGRNVFAASVIDL
jgi:ABC-2 type transport system permease protein